MAKIQQCVLIAALVSALMPITAIGQKFLPDDPIQAGPCPMPVGRLLSHDVDPLYDFLMQSISPNPRPPVPAGAINTLGEVPDSSWFTNRHARNRMDRDQLQRGPFKAGPPIPPFTVIGGKDDGITPGFRLLDSAGRLYFVKMDPASNPEMATAADVIVSRFFYALGYNTPENYIVLGKSSDFHVSNKAKLKIDDGRSRPFTQKDLDVMFRRIPRAADGSFRIMASLAVEGQLVGPFHYHGVRSDDPNDIVPHQNRRDLRGLSVFAAWLNHTDAKASNSLDTIADEDGTRFIRHYLIDFGSALGSDGDRKKNPRMGNEFILPTLPNTLKSIFTLGLIPTRWERARFPHLPAVGNLDSESFEPEKWKTNYPNAAFLSRLPDDEFWAAKQVMAFTDEDIRTIVETGKFTDPRVVDYLTKTLAERRDKIGRAYFSKVTPIDHFRIDEGELQFEDLAVKYRFRSTIEYKVRWFAFDNIRQTPERLMTDGGAYLPFEAYSAAAGSYFLAVIDQVNEELKSVRVYIRRAGQGYEVVGVERTWPGSGMPEIDGGILRGAQIAQEDQ
jgi:hypothetical protein